MGLLEDLAGNMLGGAAAPQAQSAGGLNPQLVGGILEMLGGGAAGGSQGGGGLGALAGAALGGAGGGGMGGILGAALGGGVGGGGLQSGLGALLAQFAANGLGHLVQSWISTGPNQPITVEQVHQGLGADTMNAMSQRTGISLDQLGPLLAQALPQVVNHVTPNGSVADAAAAPQGMDLLKSILGG